MVLNGVRLDEKNIWESLKEINKCEHISVQQTQETSESKLLILLGSTLINLF